VTDRLLHDLVAVSAARAPERTAIVDGDRSLTYAELDAITNRLAHLLTDRGVSRGDRVGLLLDRSLESLVGIYGVLKAGATYVPLDSDAPLTRLAYIARNAGVQCLLTGTEKAGDWAELAREGAPIETLVVLNGEAEVEAAPPGIDILPRSALDAYRDGDPPPLRLSPDDLAYILYTSGSTGDPKGVMLSHANALGFVNWAAGEFQVSEADRLSNHAPLHFDLSVFDLFAAGWAGAAVVLVPPTISIFPVELARFMRDAEISVWYSVPSILTMLVLRGKLHETELPALRTILFAGEVFPTKYLHQLMQLLPGVRFANLYGPTETNVCTWYEVPRFGGTLPDSIPIGRAITDVEVFAVTDDGRIANPEEVGELCVRGPTVMHGYWGDPERTARSLEPADDVSGERVYKTGDLVRLDAHGNWLYLGRRDAQIKSRGYRIELGEIETTLNLHPDVVECAVLAVPDEVVTNRIKAFVVARGDVGEEELIGFCLDRLPRYMVPEFFEFRDELPKSSTGKISRKALV
jgi:amino acid adenylation domain-containing protein